MQIFAVAVSRQVYEIILGYSEGANQIGGQFLAVQDSSIGDLVTHSVSE